MRCSRVDTPDRVNWPTDIARCPESPACSALGGLSSSPATTQAIPVLTGVKGASRRSAPAGFGP